MQPNPPKRFKYIQLLTLVLLTFYKLKVQQQAESKKPTCVS